MSPWSSPNIQGYSSAQLASSVRALEESFNSTTNLLGLQQNSTEWSPDLDRISHTWTEIRASYTQLMWQSREIVGRAHAIADDFSDVFIQTVLLDRGLNMSQVNDSATHFYNFMQQEERNARQLIEAYRSLGVKVNECISDYSGTARYLGGFERLLARKQHGVLASMRAVSTELYDIASSFTQWYPDVSAGGCSSVMAVLRSQSSNPLGNSRSTFAPPPDSFPGNVGNFPNSTYGGPTGWNGTSGGGHWLRGAFASMNFYRANNPAPSTSYSPGATYPPAPTSYSTTATHYSAPQTTLNPQTSHYNSQATPYNSQPSPVSTTATYPPQTMEYPASPGNSSSLASIYPHSSMNYLAPTTTYTTATTAFSFRPATRINTPTSTTYPTNYLTQSGTYNPTTYPLPPTYAPPTTAISANSPPMYPPSHGPSSYFSPSPASSMRSPTAGLSMHNRKDESQSFPTLLLTVVLSMWQLISVDLQSLLNARQNWTSYQSNSFHNEATTIANTYKELSSLFHEFQNALGPSRYPYRGD
ncbi:unnamed protein product [Somion occarium]|uniref:Uncharacterized protein n=1 Tax=Somion occarium TaxID=3059160 RepID=A0ABP1E8J7_9APHY